MQAVPSDINHDTNGSVRLQADRDHYQIGEGAGRR
jgi:hypothetical protein